MKFVYSFIQFVTILIVARVSFASFSSNYRNSLNSFSNFLLDFDSAFSPCAFREREAISKCPQLSQVTTNIYSKNVIQDACRNTLNHLTCKQKYVLDACGNETFWMFIERDALKIGFQRDWPIKYAECKELMDYQSNFGTPLFISWSRSFWSDGLVEKGNRWKTKCIKEALPQIQQECGAYRNASENVWERGPNGNVSLFCNDTLKALKCAFPHVLYPCNEHVTRTYFESRLNYVGIQNFSILQELRLNRSDCYALYDFFLHGGPCLRDCPSAAFHLPISMLILIISSIEFSQIMGTPNPKISTESLAKNAEDKAFRVFAAFIKGTDEVAGFTFFVYNFSLGMGRYIKMNSLYVHEPYRRRGIAKALFTEIAKVAHSEGIIQIGWTVLEHNKVGREFYAKLGAIDLTELIGWHEMRLNLNEITALVNQNND